MANELEVRTTTGAATSLQVVQDIYNDLTGKTEASSRLFFDAHVASLSDLENLHAVVEQSLEQYNFTVSNCSVTVKFCDGKSENFSGFAKFKRFGTSRSLPTVEVEFEYDFLIILPKTSEAKPYKMVVGLRSGIGVIERFKHTNATETEKSMYFELQSGTARFEIHYVDLAVARSLEAVVEEWYRGLKKAPLRKLTALMKSVSRAIPSVIRSLVAAAALWVSFAMLHETVIYNMDLFRALLVSAAATGISLSFSVPISGYIARVIERSRPSSAIMISKADSELYEVTKNSTGIAVVKAIASGLGAILLGLVSAYIGALIGIG